MPRSPVFRRSIAALAGAALPTWLTLRRHSVTLENLTNLDALPPTGAWIALGSPRNVDGSGAPGTVFGFVP